MPESHPETAPDDRVTPANGLTASVADPNVTSGGESIVASRAVVTLASQRYQLLAEIAHGGMGVIWRATDTVLGREVAVKVLQGKYGLDSGVARRFAAEARITAQLQHPAIPPVHDCGTLPDGRPFLAMKLIKGCTLEQMLRQRSDPSSDRGRFLAVFEHVCQAVAYAHAHNVIHRDLKPANVMVGGFGEVQVMDWGLAKVLNETTVPIKADSEPGETLAATLIRSSDADDSDASYTQAGSVLGTLAYMPPEQAAGEIAKVDQRSDVFGLGAMLTVILTGTPPYSGSDAEAVRIMAIRGDLTACRERLDGCAAEAELVALCKRCLAFAPADRPRDAGAVAEEVASLRAAAEDRARRAEMERVQAEGEKAAAEVRSQERRRRRRLVLTAAAALVLATVAGLTAVLIVQRRANADLGAKNRELADEQARVQARFELAQKAIATFHTGVSEDVLLKNDQFKELRARLLRQAAAFYGDMEKLLEGQSDVKSRRLLAEGYFQLGQLTTKIGPQPEALSVQRKALALRRELAAEPGADVETRLDVARSLRAIGLLLRAMGDRAAAMSAHEEQRDIAGKLEVESPTEPVHALLAQSHHNIGMLLTEARKPAEALASYKEAVSIRRKLVEANPTVADFQRDLANSHHNIAAVLTQTGKPDEALAAFQETLAIWQKLADANPTIPDFQGDLASNYYNIAILLNQTGKRAEALAAHEKARAIRQKLAEANPAVTELQSSLAWSHYLIGILRTQLGKPAEALLDHEKARAIRQKLAELNPTIAEFRRVLAWSEHNIGSLLSQLGKPDEALTAYEKERSIWQQLADTNPSVIEFQRALAVSHQLIGWILLQKGKQVEALADHKKTLAIRQKLAESNPTVPDFQSDLAGSCYYTGRLLARLGRFEEAFAVLDRGQSLFQQLSDAHSENATLTLRLGYSHAFRGAARARAGRSAEAAVDLRKALYLWSHIKDLDDEDHMERARALALMVGLSAEAKSGVTAAEIATFADQAVAEIQDAIQAGWKQLNELKEPDFDPIRKRADFQKLVTELAAKAAAAGRTNLDAPPLSEKK